MPPAACFKPLRLNREGGIQPFGRGEEKRKDEPVSEITGEREPVPSEVIGIRGQGRSESSNRHFDRSYSRQRDGIK